MCPGFLLVVFDIAIALAFVSTRANASTIFSDANDFRVGPGIHVPIHHARNKRLTPHRTRALYSEGDTDGRGKHGTSREQVRLSDFMDATYSITINIGGTDLSVDIDTGSSDLWVISDICTSPACTRIKEDSSNAQSPAHSERKNLQLYPQANSNTSSSSSKFSNTSPGFRSSSYSISLFYGDSLTGTHALGVVGTDAMEINIKTMKSSNTSRQDHQLGLPVLKPQFFAAINDTNTSVLETGCVGILGLGFPINSALSLELFEKDHPELSSESNVNRKFSNSHSPPQVNYNGRTPTWDQKNTPTTQDLNRRTFPDLSKYAARPSNTSQSKPSSGTSTNRRSHDQETDSRRRSDVEENDNSTSAPSSPSSWTPLLLSAFNISGPPIWRIVTNAISTEGSEQVQSMNLKPMFSVSLQRETNTGNNDGLNRGHDYDTRIDYDKGNPGILTIGGFPPGIGEDDLTWAEVRRYGVEDGGLRGGPGAEDEVYPITWEIPIDDVYLDGRKLPRSAMVDPAIGVTGLIDTGNSLIRGPPDVIRYMKNLIRQENIGDYNEQEKVQRPEDESTSTSCSISHILSFQIGGKLFPVDPKDLIWVDEDSEDGQQCYLNIAPTDVPIRGGSEENGGYLYSWSLGDPFLKSVLASFYYGHTARPSWDPPRIGLMSTISQVALESSKPRPESLKSSHEGEKERGGAIPGVIQRPELPLPAVLDAVSHE